MTAVAATGFPSYLTAWATAAAAVGTVSTLVFLVFQLADERRVRTERHTRLQAEQVSGSDRI